MILFQVIIPLSSSCDCDKAVQLLSECDSDGALYPSSSAVTLVWVALECKPLYKASSQDFGRAYLIQK